MTKRSHEDDIVCIRHMLDFAQKAVAFNRGRNRSELDSNEIMALATIHLIELIGEASHSVSEAFQEKYPEVPWRSITGTRNRLAHGYIDVELDVIWTSKRNRITPKLAKYVVPQRCSPTMNQ